MISVPGSLLIIFIWRESLGSVQGLFRAKPGQWVCSMLLGWVSMQYLCESTHTGSLAVSVQCSTELHVRMYLETQLQALAQHCESQICWYACSHYNHSVEFPSTCVHEVQYYIVQELRVNQCEWTHVIYCMSWFPFYIWFANFCFPSWHLVKRILVQKNL